MNALDEMVVASLRSFAAEALDGSWRGRREREAVSLFVMGHLLREVTAGHAIRHPTQLGIEVPVPQITGADRKTQVCKDVVIWPEPRMTCWDVAQQPTVPPIGILEWKFPSRRVYSGDVEWLRSFSRMHPACTGYAISADLPGGAFRLSCTRVSGGIAEPEWLVIR